MTTQNEQWNNRVSGRGVPDSVALGRLLQTGIFQLSDTPLSLRASSAESERTAADTCQCGDDEHEKHLGTSCTDKATRHGLCTDCYQHLKQRDPYEGES